MKEHNSKILLMEVPLRISKLFEAQRTTYSIVSADSIDSALKLIEEENIKLCVLSDNFLEMEMFIREVRNTPLASELPLLVITSTRTHEELFKLGADAFFATTESDARFLEKIELLLGLGDSNRSNVFVKRTETENPFYFVLQYASQMAASFGSVTPTEHERVIPDDESLYSLIQLAEKNNRESDRLPAAVVYTEGLEAVEPQGYIDHQLSVGERMESTRRESGSEFNFSFQTRVSADDIVREYRLPKPQPPKGSALGPAEDADSDVENTNVLLNSLKNREGVQHQAPASGNTLSQPFSIPSHSGFPRRKRDGVELNQVSGQSIENIDDIGKPYEKTVALNPLKDANIKADVGVVFENPPHRNSTTTDGVMAASVVDNAPPNVANELNVEKSSESLPPSGNVENFSVWQIFVKIMTTRFSGTVKISRKGVIRQFHCDAGELMVVSSNAKEDRLVELLFRDGRISEQQYESASMIVAASGRRAGVVMVDKGILSSRELFPVVRYHYESMLLDTFSWPDGEWQASEGPYRLKERIVMDTPLPALILDAFRGVVPAMQINNIVSELNPKIRDDIPSEVVDNLSLAEVEREILEWSDGTRSIAWIAHRVGMEKRDLKSLVAGLIALDVLEPMESTELGALSASDSQLESPVSAPRSKADTGTDMKDGVDVTLIDDKWDQVIEGTYFDIAEVSSDASALEIRQSLQRLKSIYSPTRFSDMTATETHEKLKTIGDVLLEATDVLLNDEIREQYRKAVQKRAPGD